MTQAFERTFGRHPLFGCLFFWGNCKKQTLSKGNEGDLCTCANNMEKAVQYFLDQISGIICGAVTPSLIDTIRVMYHGEMTPIKQLASTTTRDSRITVTPYDPAMLRLIETTLKEAGYNAYVFSKTTVCVNTPPMGADERDRVIKQVKKMAEEARVSVRNIRKKTKQGFDGLPDSEKSKAEKSLQKTTDECISQIDTLAESRVKYISG